MSDDRPAERSAEHISMEPNRLQVGGTEAAVEVRLADQFQRRNMILYVLKWCLVYSAATAYLLPHRRDAPSPATASRGGPGARRP
ncbi:MAG: hypothetical protein O3C40_18695 [Planctomycetota bacterium]|nr:hypothetical protein [Planctomycetota bacterium]